jgi:hypothetical protein
MINSLPWGSRGGLWWGCLGFSTQLNLAVIFACKNCTFCGDVCFPWLATLAPHPNPPLQAGEGTYLRELRDARLSWRHCS